MSRHIHTDCIIAWAEGKVVQIKVSDLWKDLDNTNFPMFHINWEYRIKPEPKPDIVSYAHAKVHENVNDGMNAFITHGSSRYDGYENIKITFEGETKKLKSVALIGDHNA